MKISDLETLPDRLRTAREDLLEKGMKLETLQREMEKTRLKYKAQVSAERDDLGKNKYPNEPARDAATANWLGGDTQYQRHLAELDASRLDIEKQKIEVSFLMDRMEIARTMAMLGDIAKETLKGGKK